MNIEVIAKYTTNHKPPVLFQCIMAIIGNKNRTPMNSNLEIKSEQKYDSSTQIKTKFYKCQD